MQVPEPGLHRPEQHSPSRLQVTPEALQQTPTVPPSVGSWQAPWPAQHWPAPVHGWPALEQQRLLTHSPLNGKPMQQSDRCWQRPPGGEQLHVPVPPSQSPLQQSAPVAQAPLMPRQHWPAVHRPLQQLSPGTQAPPSGLQQEPNVALQMVPAQHGLPAEQLLPDRWQHVPATQVLLVHWVPPSQPAPPAWRHRFPVPQVVPAQQSWELNPPGHDPPGATQAPHRSGSGAPSPRQRSWPQHWLEVVQLEAVGEQQVSWPPSAPRGSQDMVQQSTAPAQVACPVWQLAWWHRPSSGLHTRGDWHSVLFWQVSPSWPFLQRPAVQRSVVQQSASWPQV